MNKSSNKHLSQHHNSQSGTSNNETRTRNDDQDQKPQKTDDKNTPSKSENKHNTTRLQTHVSIKPTQRQRSYNEKNREPKNDEDSDDAGESEKSTNDDCVSPQLWSTLLNIYDKYMSDLDQFVKNHHDLKKLQILDFQHRISLYNNQNEIEEKQQLFECRQDLLSLDLESEINEHKQSIESIKETSNHRTVPKQNKSDNDIKIITITLRLCDGISKNNHNNNVCILSHPAQHFDINVNVNKDLSLSDNIKTIMHSLTQQQRIHIVPSPPARQISQLKFLLFKDITTTVTSNNITLIKQTSELHDGETYLLTHDMTNDRDKNTSLFLYQKHSQHQPTSTEHLFEFAYIDIPSSIKSMSQIHNIVQPIFKIQHNITYHKLDGTIISNATSKSYIRIISQQQKRGRQSSTPTHTKKNQKVTSDDQEYDDDDDDDIKYKTPKRKRNSHNDDINSHNDDFRSEGPLNKKPRGRPSKHNIISKNDIDDDDKKDHSFDMDDVEDDDEDEKQIPKNPRGPSKDEKSNDKDDSHHDEKDHIPQIKRPRGRPPKNKSIDEKDDDKQDHSFDDENDKQIPKKPRGRPHKKSHDKDDLHDDEKDNIPKIKRPRGRPPKINPDKIKNDESDDIKTPKKSRGRPPKNKDSKPDSSHEKRNIIKISAVSTSKQSMNDSDDDDDDDDDDSEPPLKKPRGRPPKKQQHDDDGDDDDDDDDGEPLLKKPRGRPPKKQQHADDDDDDVSDDDSDAKSIDEHSKNQGDEKKTVKNQRGIQPKNKDGNNNKVESELPPTKKRRGRPPKSNSDDDDDDDQEDMDEDHEKKPIQQSQRKNLLKRTSLLKSAKPRQL